MPNDVGFSLKLEPELRDAFVAATSAAHRPAAQVVRDMMREYVERQAERAFADEARRQSLAIARRSATPGTDDHASLGELDALLLLGVGPEGDGE